MCPDPQVVSLYYDGELPSPWKEKMEAHLGVCPVCRACCQEYREMSAALAGVPVSGGVPVVDGEKAMEKARERVRQKLAAFDALPGVLSFKTVEPERSVWKRSISLPLPAAAAAALFIIVLFIALAGRSAPVDQNPDTAVAGLIQDMQGIVPVSDMQGVLQYLGNQESADFVILRLPESRNFTSAGEPAFIRAADYSHSRRRQSP